MRKIQINSCFKFFSRFFWVSILFGQENEKVRLSSLLKCKTECSSCTCTTAFTTAQHQKFKISCTLEILRSYQPLEQVHAQNLQSEIGSIPTVVRRSHFPPNLVPTVFVPCVLMRWGYLDVSSINQSEWENCYQTSCDWFWFRFPVDKIRNKTRFFFFLNQSPKVSFVWWT